jgi:hypothetical protein
MTSSSDALERLRTAYQRVQASKRGDAPLDMQPVWDIINAVPEVVALLSNHAEFEHDAAVEERDATIERLSAELERVKGEDREARWARWPQGDAGDAIDFACDHISPMPKMRWFLEDWRGGKADEWPDYMRWLNVQREGARAALNNTAENSDV